MADLGINQIWSCSGEPNAAEQVPAADICSEYRSFLSPTWSASSFFLGVLMYFELIIMLYSYIFMLFPTRLPDYLIQDFLRLPDGLSDICKIRAAVSCSINLKFY